jgi:hypothetical protein
MIRACAEPRVLQPGFANEQINHVALLAAPSLFTDLQHDTATAFEAVGLVNNAPMVPIGRRSIAGEDRRTTSPGFGFKPTVVARRRRLPTCRPADRKLRYQGQRNEVGFFAMLKWQL